MEAENPYFSRGKIEKSKNMMNFLLSDYPQEATIGARSVSICEIDLSIPHQERCPLMTVGSIFCKEGFRQPMKLNGSHKFNASSETVYNAILNPNILKDAMPGCSGASYTDSDTLQLDITTPLPGLKGPYALAIGLANRQPNNHLELVVQRSGRAGTINAVCKIDIADTATGSEILYNAEANLSGPVAIADNNLIGRPMVNNVLEKLFGNLEKLLSR